MEQNFAKELIERYGICFPEGCEHDDDTFWMLYSLFAKDVYFLSERLYNYRIRVNSIMSNYFNKKPKNKYDRYRVCNFVYDFCKEKGCWKPTWRPFPTFTAGRRE